MQVEGLEQGSLVFACNGRSQLPLLCPMCIPRCGLPSPGRHSLIDACSMRAVAQVEDNV